MDGDAPSDGCCPALPARRSDAYQDDPHAVTGEQARPDGMVLLNGGSFLMGTSDPEGYPSDGEGPVRRVGIRPFWIDATTVSNARFAGFIYATDYVTEAERFGWSYVFVGLLAGALCRRVLLKRLPGGDRSMARTGATPKVRTPP